LADLGSSNGTRVNGWRVERATVDAGDELRLGEQRIVFGRPVSG
jgi:pSer/pThr/pTyr-binding forkhead associated (FHA) protein